MPTQGDQYAEFRSRGPAHSAAVKVGREAGRLRAEKRKAHVIAPQRKRRLMPPPSSLDGIEIDHAKFWKYCQAAVGMSRARSRKIKVPHDIEAGDIDELIIDQGYRCAVSGIVLQPSSARFGGPFGPSLDRIKPPLGYVRGNLRVVCHMVNLAMNEWGLEALELLVEAMATNRERTKSNKKSTITGILMNEINIVTNSFSRNRR